MCDPKMHKDVISTERTSLWDDGFCSVWFRLHPHWLTEPACPLTTTLFPHFQSQFFLTTQKFFTHPNTKFVLKMFDEWIKTMPTLRLTQARLLPSNLYFLLSIARACTNGCIFSLSIPNSKYLPLITKIYEVSFGWGEGGKRVGTGIPHYITS